jgi:1-acyl-sn-glycerol-3-phosphate acyltransferase
MTRIIASIYTGLVWLYTAFAFSTHALLVALALPFIKDREGFSVRLTYPFCNFAFWLFRFPVTTIGREHLPKGPCILISNHQSLIDIVAILCGTRKVMSFIAKKELLDVPILGWDMKIQGHIPIDRTDSRGSIQALKQVETQIKNGKSLILFAEGTRTHTGKIGPFKKGAFMMAVNTQVPIIPCCISGAFNVLPKHTMILRPGKIRLQIGAPIYPTPCNSPGEVKSQAEALMETCRNQIVEMYQDQNI